MSPYRYWVALTSGDDADSKLALALLKTLVTIRMADPRTGHLQTRVLRGLHHARHHHRPITRSMRRLAAHILRTAQAVASFLDKARLRMHLRRSNPRVQIGSIKCLGAHSMALASSNPTNRQ